MIDYSQNRPLGSSLRFFALWAFGLSALLALSSEIQGDSIALTGRFLYWLLHIGLGLLVITGLAKWLQSVGLNRLNTWLQLVITGFVGSVAFVPIAAALELWLPPTYAPDGHGDLQAAIATVGMGRALLDEFLALVPITATIWLIINVAYIAREQRAADVRRADEPVAPIAAAVTPKPNATDRPARDAIVEKADSAGAVECLFSKLKPALGRDVIVLRSDLNYLHVHTSKGRTMLMYSLSRAAEELGAGGIVVHRSYWIAKAHVMKVQRKGQQYTCLMSDGTTVPVSRRRQNAVVKEFGNNFTRTDADAHPTAMV